MLVRKRPGGPLAAFLESFWYAERREIRHPRERLLPTGQTFLSINLTETPVRLFADDEDRTGREFREGVIWGPRSRYGLKDTSRAGRSFGISFRTGQSPGLLAISANELAHQQVALNYVWGREGRELRERLLDAPDAAAAFAIVEERLYAKFRRPFLAHPAVAHALEGLRSTAGTASVRRISRETGYSQKHLIHSFRQQVGVAPKLFGRLYRFQQALRQLQGERVEWSALAAQTGFYDQSHLHREFRLLAGTTPAEYALVDRESPNHVAVAR